METKEKSIWKSELIKGIIIGCILTAIGTCAGVTLQQCSETKKNDRELGMKVCEIVNSHLYTAENVSKSVGNSVFQDRWNTYINQGYIPWLINKNLCNEFIKSEHNSLSDKFNEVDTQFDELHNLLNDLRGSINTKQSEDSIGKAKNKVKTKINNEIKKNVEEINSQLYQF